MNFLKANKITRVLNATAAGATDITTATVVDMQNWERVTFLVSFGAIVTGAATSIRVQQGAAADMSDAADLAGTDVTVPDDGDNKVYAVEVERPRERYVKVVVKRGTQNATVDSAIAIQSGPRVMPVTQSTTVGATEFHVSPAEGTA